MLKAYFTQAGFIYLIMCYHNFLQNWSFIQPSTYLDLFLVLWCRVTMPARVMPLLCWPVLRTRLFLPCALPMLESSVLPTDLRPVQMGRSDWWAPIPPLGDVWKCATEIYGEQSVITRGMTLMQLWCADNLGYFLVSDVLVYKAVITSDDLFDLRFSSCCT